MVSECPQLQADVQVRYSFCVLETDLCSTESFNTARAVFHSVNE